MLKLSEKQMDTAYRLTAASVEGFIESYEEGSIMIPPYYGAECIRLYKKVKKAIKGKDLYAKRWTVVYHAADEIDDFFSRIDIFG